MSKSSLKPILLCALLLAACKRGDDAAQSAPPAGAAVASMNGDPAQNTYAPALNVTLSQFTKLPSGLYVLDTSPGTGPEATSGKTVKVHYTGWLANGKQFDSSKGSDPIEFPLGQGAVIRGWDEGIAGMKVGGKRRLVIPADLGYGATGAPPDIPPGAVLVFDVELVAAS